MPMYAGVYTDHRHVCIGNHIISSAIWDKSAQENFSKTNQFPFALRARAIWLVFDNFTSTDLF